MASGTIKAVAPASSTLRDVAFYIPASSWTLSGGSYVYTVPSGYITSASMDFVTFDSSIRNCPADVTSTKVSGGGGMRLSTAELPLGNLNGHIYTIANEDGKTTVLVENSYIFKPLTIALDNITNATGAYTHTTTNNKVTEDMKPVNIEFGTTSTIQAPVTITTGDHSVTLSCAKAIGSSTVTVTLMPTESIEWAQDVPGGAITSSEGDVLADRIGTLSTLLTTDKTSTVGAINSLFTKETFSLTAGTGVTLNSRAVKCGSICSISFSVTSNIARGSWKTIATIPSGYRPYNTTDRPLVIPITSTSVDLFGVMRVNFNGVIEVYFYGSGNTTAIGCITYLCE